MKGRCYPLLIAFTLVYALATMIIVDLELQADSLKTRLRECQKK